MSQLQDHEAWAPYSRPSTSVCRIPKLENGTWRCQYVDNRHKTRKGRHIIILWTQVPDKILAVSGLASISSVSRLFFCPSNPFNNIILTRGWQQSLDTVREEQEFIVKSFFNLRFRYTNISSSIKPTIFEAKTGYRITDFIEMDNYKRTPLPVYITMSQDFVIRETQYFTTTVLIDKGYIKWRRSHRYAGIFSDLLSCWCCGASDLVFPL